MTEIISASVNHHIHPVKVEIRGLRDLFLDKVNVLENKVTLLENENAKLQNHNAVLTDIVVNIQSSINQTPINELAM